MDKTDSLKLVAMLTAAWSNWKPNDDAIELYARMLAPLPKEIAEEAVMELIRDDTLDFVPTIGKIFAKATKVALHQAGYSIGNAEEAWQVVNNAIRFRGWYQGPGELDGDLSTRKAVDAIGWDHICHDENVAATRAHFMRLYESYEKRELEECKQRLIAGQPVFNRLPFIPPALEGNDEDSD